MQKVVELFSDWCFCWDDYCCRANTTCMYWFKCSIPIEMNKRPKSELELHTVIRCVAGWTLHGCALASIALLFLSTIPLCCSTVVCALHLEPAGPKIKRSLCFVLCSLYLVQNAHIIHIISELQHCVSPFICSVDSFSFSCVCFCIHLTWKQRNWCLSQSFSIFSVRLFCLFACLLARVFYCVCVLNMRQNGSWYFRQTDRSVILLKRESKHNKRMCNKQESIVFRNVSVVAMMLGPSAGYIYVRSFNDRNAQNARPNCLERSHWTFGIYYVCNS